MTDITTTQQGPPMTRRLDFSANTKTTLYHRSGGRCAFRDCLCDTVGPTKNDKGEPSYAGIAIAAHIHAARENGPRGQGGLTPEQIRSASNGLWMCAYHGRLVDDYKDLYPPESLLRMKAVREFAQSLQINDPDIRNYVPLVGVRSLDACIWEKLPDLTEAACELPGADTVKRLFVARAIHKLAIHDLVDTAMQPDLPDHMRLKALYRAIVAANPVGQDSIEQDNTGPALRVTVAPARESRDAIERQRAVAIVKAWVAPHHPVVPDNALIFHRSSVLLSARHPQTGAILRPGIWQRCTSASHVRYSLEEGELVTLEVLGSSDGVSGLCWKLSVKLRAGKHEIASTLHPVHYGTPYLNELDDPETFEAFRELVARLASGWQAIGYLSEGSQGQEFGEHDRLHPAPFDIDLGLSPAQLAAIQARCDKVEAGREIAKAWDADFIFDDVFFLPAIDIALLRRASEALGRIGDEHPGNPGQWTTGPLWMEDPRIGIRLRFNGCLLQFERFRPARASGPRPAA